VKRDHETLATVGEALFGERWQRPLARALGASERIMRYWAAGKFESAIPWADIAALCRARGSVLAKLAERLVR
jgi:hypothetical protein